MKKLFALASVSALSVASAFANTPEPDVVTLPDTGVNIADYISAGITYMGGVVAVAVGGYAAFLIVRKALRWIGRALS